MNDYCLFDNIMVFLVVLPEMISRRNKHIEPSFASKVRRALDFAAKNCFNLRIFFRSKWRFFGLEFVSNICFALLDYTKCDDHPILPNTF